MDIIIKELENNVNQIKKVQKFLFNQIRIEYGYGYIPEYHYDIKNLKEYYILPDRNKFIIALNEKFEIIATLGLRAYDKDFYIFDGIYSGESTASIWRLFVDEKYRRCGVASQLYRIIEDFAYECRYNEIYLHTHKNLSGAMSFWKKMGFNITVDADNGLQTVHMDKKINHNNIIPEKLSYAGEVKSMIK